MAAIRQYLPILIISGLIQIFIGQVAGSRICPSGFQSFRSGSIQSLVCVRIMPPQGWDAAVTSCRSMYSDMLSFQSPGEEVTEQMLCELADMYQLNDTINLWTSMRVLGELLWWDDIHPMPFFRYDSVVTRGPPRSSCNVLSNDTRNWWAEGQPSLSTGQCGSAKLQRLQADNLSLVLQLDDCGVQLPYACTNEGFEYGIKQLPTCSANWYGNEYSGHCLAKSDFNNTYVKSIEACETFGSVPALSYSADVDAMLTQLVPTSETVWLGGQVSAGWVLWENGLTVRATDYTPRLQNPQDEGCLAYEAASDDWAVRSCDVFFGVVCQKDSEAAGNATILHGPKDQWLSVWDWHKSQNEDPVLSCNATNYHPLLPVIWVKRHYYSVNDHPEQGFNMQLTLELSYELTMFGRHPIPITLMGEYRCEVSGAAPSSRTPSPPATVNFHDVATLRTDLTFYGRVYDPRWRDKRLLGHIPDDYFYFRLLTALFTCQVGARDQWFFVDILEYSYGVVVPALLHYPKLGQEHEITGPPEDAKRAWTSEVYYAVTKALAYRLAGRDEDWQQEYGAYNITEDQIALGVEGADVCFRGFTLSPTGQDLDWPESLPGTSINSAETCIWDGEPLARRSCVLRDDLPPYWGGVTFRDCSPIHTSPVTDGLQNLTEEVVTSSNATSVSNMLVDLTSEPELLAPIDVVLTSQVLENLVNVKSLSLEVGQEVLETISQTVMAGEEVVAEAQRVYNSSNRMLSSMDTFAGTAELGSLNSSILVQPKVAMGVYDVIEGMNTRGFAMMKIENDTLTEQNIQVISESTDIGDLKSAQAWILLPPEVIELAQNATEQQRKLLDDPTSDADLKEVIRTHPVRLSFQTYQDTSLFQTPGQIHQADTWSRAGSKIIGATLQGYGLKAITNLIQPVKQTFQIAKQASERHCAFWDFSAAGGQGNWSTEGCNVVTADETHITCACNHLTNFAIIMDAMQEKLPPIHNQILSVISIIGLILSITGLSLTIITLIVFRDDLLTKRVEERTRTTKQVLLNLALALLLVYILFLAGIEQTHNKAACQAMSAFIYYFLLVAFAWMLVEGVLQYHQLVKIMPRLPEKFMLKAAVPAWGIPMLAVTIVAAVDSDSLITAKYCWLDSYAFYFGFLVPIGCVIIVNSVLYTLVIRRLTCGQMEGSAKSKQVSTSAQLWISVTCFVVLGITWIFGFLAVADARLVFQYLFCIFNSIQGFLIFILHCLRNKKIQRALLELCRCSHMRNWASSKSLRCYAKGSRRSSKNASSQQTELSTINSSSVT